MTLRFSPRLMRESAFESLNDQGREAQRSVGHGGGLEVWGGGLWSAAEGRPKAPWSSGRDRRCGWADGLRGLGRDGPIARTKRCRSRQRMLPCTDPPALGVAGSDGHTQRQQPERLPPGHSEHFWRGSPRQRCGGIAAGDDQAEGLPRSGNGGSELARLRDC